MKAWCDSENTIKTFDFYTNKIFFHLPFFFLYLNTCSCSCDCQMPVLILFTLNNILRWHSERSVSLSIALFQTI